ncbi:hypothetical protein GCM10022205_13450 [Spinactinospora alkalitolerans]
MFYLWLVLAGAAAYILVGAVYMWLFYRRALRGADPCGCPQCRRRAVLRERGAVRLSQQPAHRRLVTWVVADLGWPIRLAQSLLERPHRP